MAIRVIFPGLFRAIKNEAARNILVLVFLWTYANLLGLGVKLLNQSRGMFIFIRTQFCNLFLKRILAIV